MRSTDRHQLRKLVRRFETQNTILIGRSVWHHIDSDKNGAVAWTVGNNIHFNAPKLPDPDTRRNIMYLTGVNNHELSHVMFTPHIEEIKFMSYGYVVADSMEKDPVYRWLFNVLEDQRIEMLKLVKHTNQRPYFIVMFVKAILSHKDDVGTQYLLARGRKYLPVSIRRRLKRKFKAQAAIPEIRRIIDSYLKLNLFDQVDLMKAHQLVLDLKKVLEDHQLFDNNSTQPVCRAFDDSQAVPATPEERAAAAETTKKLIKVLGSLGQSEGEDTKDSSSDNIDDGSVFDGALNDVENSSIVDADIRDVQDYIQRASDIDFQHIQSRVPVPDDLPFLATRTSAAFRELEAETDPYWEGGVNSGKLNPMYAMTHPEDREHAFRRWTDGGSAGNDQEWVVLLDCSSSMRKNLGELAKSAWVLKRATDELQIRTTVIAYGSESHQRLVYGPDEFASTHEMLPMESLSNTVPGPALAEAYDVLKASSRKHRGMFVMTDGAWQAWINPPVRSTGWATNEDPIKAMNQLGIMTHLCFLGGQSLHTRSCTTNSQITEVSQIVDVVQTLMKVMMVNDGY